MKLVEPFFGLVSEALCLLLASLHELNNRLAAVAEVCELAPLFFFRKELIQAKKYNNCLLATLLEQSVR